MAQSHPRPARYCTWKRLSLLLPMLALLLVTGLGARQQTDLDVVYAVAPEWPALDYANLTQPREEAVLVKIGVDGFGNVVDSRSLSPQSIFSASALHAARLWKFAGPSPDAKILGMTATLKFTFRIVPTGTSADETGTAFIPPYEVSLSRLAIQKH
jgi:hypothetical protein